MQVTIIALSLADSCPKQAKYLPYLYQGQGKIQISFKTCFGKDVFVVYVQEKERTHCTLTHY